MKPFLPRLVSLAALTAFAGAAHAALIEFENLVPLDDYGFLRTYGDTVECDGFVFTGGQWASWLPSAPTFAGGDYTGSTALWTQDPGSVLTMARSGGGTFSLREMELAHAFLGFGGPEEVTFVGTKADGSEVTRVFALLGGEGLQPVAFSGFTGLVSVRWNQTPGLHQFDNVRVDAVQPTPGPAAAAPFALMLLRRRRRA